MFPSAHQNTYQYCAMSGERCWYSPWRYQWQGHLSIPSLALEKSSGGQRHQTWVMTSPRHHHKWLMAMRMPMIRLHCYLIRRNLMDTSIQAHDYHMMITWSLENFSQIKDNVVICFYYTKVSLPWHRGRWRVRIIGVVCRPIIEQASKIIVCSPQNESLHMCIMDTCSTQNHCMWVLRRTCST